MFVRMQHSPEEHSRPAKPGKGNHLRKIRIRIHSKVPLLLTEPHAYMRLKERETSGRVRLPGAEVVKVQEFKYLGTTVQSSGDCGREVKNRAGGESQE